jgi:7-cyano-7-deazaguanine synthase
VHRALSDDMDINLKALLFSGGIESTALAFAEKPDICITVNYGQPSAVGEIRSARSISGQLGLRHEAICVTPYAAAAPSLDQETKGIFWPLRNQLLITLAGVHLVNRGLSEVIIGLVRDDVYADCKTPFVEDMNRTLESQDAGFSVGAPAITMTTLELLRRSRVPYELLSLTLSCQVSDYACGMCAGCLKSKLVLQKYKRHSKLTLVASQ